MTKQTVEVDISHFISLIHSYEGGEGDKEVRQEALDVIQALNITREDVEAVYKEWEDDAVIESLEDKESYESMQKVKMIVLRDWFPVSM